MTQAEHKTRNEFFLRDKYKLHVRKIWRSIESATDDSDYGHVNLFV